jgi:aubergine-like protein
MTIEKDRKNQSLEQINMNYKDNSVLMKYGNMKIYRIEEIDFKQNPQSKFFNIKEGKDVTYIDYYKTRYGVNIKNVNQPLVKVIGMKQRVSNNEN